MLSGKTKAVLFLLAAAGASYVYVASSGKKITPVFETTTASSILEPVNLPTLFDIPINGYEVSRHKIRNGQFLGDILGSYGIDQRELTEMNNVYKDVFDVRKLKAENYYTLLIPEGFNEKPHYFIYELNPVEFVVYDFVRKRIYADAKKVTYEKQTASGVIESSLYKTLEDQALGGELSDVFAWVIDFYRLQKGDKFKIVYEVKVIDGEPAGVHRIISAVFNHAGNDFYAFYFQPDESAAGGYFDEASNSLRKEFLKSPLKFSRISSKFSRSRLHPVLKKHRPHLGVDYAAPTGTPILAVGDGIVVEAQYSKNNGNYVKIRHNSTYSTQYLHMSKFASGIRNGTKVSQGQVIGYVGSTGLATGPHVCFRFWKNGEQVDPLKVQLPPSKPVDSKYKAEYDAMVASLRKELDGLSY